MLAKLIATLASGEAGETARRVRRAVVAYGLVGALLVFALLFLITAGYIAAAQRFGPVEAALGFAGAFLLAGLVVLLAYRFGARARRRQIAERRRGEIASVAAAAAVTLLPTLLAGRGRLLALLVPGLALLGYGIYRENRSSPVAPRRRRGV